MIENFESKNIQSFEYTKTINSDGNIIGTCELGKAEIQMLNNTNQYNYLKEQWIKTIHGSFYIYDIESVQEKVSIKLLCYDIKYKLDTQYDSSLYTFPMTLKEWRNKIFETCDLLYDDSDFPNSDLELTEEPYIGDNPSNRDVIKIIAQAGCSFVDNDKNDIIYFNWFSEKTYAVNDWLELTTESEHSAPINVVTLGRGDVQDNVSYPEELPNEVSEFRIDSNYILDTQDTDTEEDIRYETIIPIYNRVKDFSYLIFNMRTQDTENRLSIKLGEKITYNDIWGNNLNAYIMSLTLKYIGGDVTNEKNYELFLSAEKINESSTELKYSSNLKNDILKVSRKADKNSGEIQDLVSETIFINEELSKTNTTANNNYQDLLSKLDEKATTESVTSVEKSVTELQTSTAQTTKIVTEIKENGVTKVKTETGFTLDEDGLHIDKTDAATGSTLDEAGLEIEDKTGSTEETQFYSGYVTEEMAEKTEELADYQGQTVTYSKNIIFNNYLETQNGRIENVYDDTYGKGIGFFVGGDS